MRTILYALFGYISGSVLYAKNFMKLFNKEELIEESKDKNPGTANAFMYGGMTCGIMTLICELLKGIVPVHMYINGATPQEIGIIPLAIVLTMPVVGHVCSMFDNFQGGKGIAVTFGCLLGLAPDIKAVIILALFFIFYSLIFRVIPHFYRTIVTYVSTLAGLFILNENQAVNVGFLFITLVVLVRLHQSTEVREKLRIKLLWMR